jgi:phenylacetic acid degradation operon negative regulatory protein
VTADSPSVRRSSGVSPAAIDLPRAQAGSPPQHLLITLLADYWSGRPEPLPSVALVALVGEFGVTAAGARAALSRLTRRGLLSAAKSGRRTYYGLTGQTAGALRAARHRTMSFGEHSGDWDGYWTIAAFSLPEERRDLRHSLRSQLHGLGFAPLFDAMWVAPHASVEQAGAVLAALDVTSATVLRARQPLRATGRAPIEAWDLNSLRDGYRAFIDDHAPLVQRIRQGQVSAREALVARTTVLDLWRGFLAVDPDLPGELLAADWPRQAARQVFAEIYDGLGELAVVRVRHVLAESAPDLASYVQQQTTTDGPGPARPGNR